MKNTIRRIITAVALAITLPAVAQMAPAPGTPGSTYTQDKLAKGEPLLIGVRASSTPLSYKDGDTYIGLAVDLCTRAFEQVKKQYPKATFNFVEVTSSNRIDFLKDKKIDLECGSTTNTASRRKEVNFSTAYYIASVVAIKLNSNPLTSISQVDEKSKVIYTAKTTTEKALSTASLVFRFKAEKKTFSTVLGKDHQESFDLLTAGKGDLFANDDILLLGLKERSKNPELYELLPEKYSIEPYGIMTRLDDQYLTTIVDKTVINTMRNGEFDKLYTRWFMQPIPPFNKALNIPMSRFLADVARMPSKDVGN